MKVIVLGASGQIGSILFNGLKDIHDVTGTSRKVCDDYIQFDPFEDDWSILGQTDVLINCVGQIEATPRSSFYRIHVELTQKILSNRSQLGNPSIIQVSALGASADHKVEFLSTKGMADNLLLQHPDTTVILPSIVCTPRTMIVRKLILLFNVARWLGGIIPVPKGFMQTKIQPVMPEDLVDMVRKLCINRSVRIVRAVGPRAISFQEIVDKMMRTRKVTFRMMEIPKALADLMVKDSFSRLFPKIINAQQYQLLFEDNIGDARDCEEFLKRPLVSTEKYFEQEFMRMN